MHTEETQEQNLYYGTTRTYQLIKKHCFGKLDSNGLKADYLQYFQITAAPPSSLKQAALLTPVCSESLFSTPDLFYLSEETTLSLSKMRCKHYFKVFNECSVSELTGIKK